MDEAAQVASRAEPRFTVSWEHERAAVPQGLSAMLEANEDDQNICEWLNAAQPGEESRWGGGSAPLCIIRRVS